MADPPAAAAEDSISPVQSTEILGFRLDLIAPAELEAWLTQAFAEPWDGRCRHIVTLNPEYVMAARKSPGFASAIREADLNTADGVGVVVAAGSSMDNR